MDTMNCKAQVSEFKYYTESKKRGVFATQLHNESTDLHRSYSQGHCVTARHIRRQSGKENEVQQKKVT